MTEIISADERHWRVRFPRAPIVLAGASAWPVAALSMYGIEEGPAAVQLVSGLLCLPLVVAALMAGIMGFLWTIDANLRRQFRSFGRARQAAGIQRRSLHRARGRVPRRDRRTQYSVRVWANTQQGICVDLLSHARRTTVIRGWDSRVVERQTFAVGEVQQAQEAKLFLLAEADRRMQEQIAVHTEHHTLAQKAAAEEELLAQELASAVKVLNA